MLEVRNLSKSFRKVKAVIDLSLAVGNGEAVGLVGPNGSGKTTTLRCICGIMKPDAGEVSFNGVNLYDNPVEAKRGLAFVPEIPYPISYLTVWEHMTFMARAYSARGWERKAEDLLNAFNMTEKRDEYCIRLSKGMKQKVMLMSAFVHEPSVLVMDEPLYGIDPQGSYELKRRVKEILSRGASVLVSSHTLSLIEEVCARVAIMSKGRIIAAGNYEELRKRVAAKKDASFEEVFVKITGG
jgi:ABC-2 type transport system ATP-binding protein